MKTALIMPIYCPSAAVLPFLSLFQDGDFSLYVVVDDGSGDEYSSIYKEIEKKKDFVVLRHPKNKGKGDALKTAFRYIKENHPEIEGAITADGDGQHTYKDILKIRDSLADHPDSYILGYRDFEGPNVPKRSKEGNDFSNWYVSYRTTVDCKDTQTGLRGIPACLFDAALKTHGSRYEYELNQLISFVQIAPVVEVMIETVYLNNNESSHFRPFKDTCRLYNGPILYVLLGVACMLIEEIAFSILFTNNFPGSWQQILLSVGAPRLIQGTAMFMFALLMCFPSHARLPRKILRFLLLIVTNIAILFGSIYGLALLGLPMWALILIKIVLDLVLAGGDFYANMMWVFSIRKK
ncbi:MAG: glycosyltransferase family 2 protein [Bacilli bacterium]|nr:glycosyltransferase family 2 protein [Bacilli bacterium]